MDGLLVIYLMISFITAFVSAVVILHGDYIEGVDNIWDWLIYSIFWIKQPLKSLIKFLFTNWK